MAQVLNRTARKALIALAGVVFSTSVYATAQCPVEFGPKDPLVNVFGWLVVALGVLAGGLFVLYVYRSSRRMRSLLRVAVILLGLVGMLVIWGGGMVLAIGFFFLRC